MSEELLKAFIEKVKEDISLSKSLVLQRPRRKLLILLRSNNMNLRLIFSRITVLKNLSCLVVE
ncbi:hypothetical protein MITS9504_00601 [Synechococcus sp. MIT S9504]|nr:hypothetical protein MITS9504_00601 [Synechococcus sp. MIT S9504]